MKHIKENQQPLLSVKCLFQDPKKKEKKKWWFYSVGSFFLASLLAHLREPVWKSETLFAEPPLKLIRLELLYTTRAPTSSSSSPTSSLSKGPPGRMMMAAGWWQARSLNEVRNVMFLLLYMFFFFGTIVVMIVCLEFFFVSMVVDAWEMLINETKNIWFFPSFSKSYCPVWNLNFAMEKSFFGGHAWVIIQ